jgi:hypothetical protein
MILSRAVTGIFRLLVYTYELLRESTASTGHRRNGNVEGTFPARLAYHWVRTRVRPGVLRFTLQSYEFLTENVHATA